MRLEGVLMFGTGFVTFESVRSAKALPGKGELRQVQV